MGDAAAALPDFCVEELRSLHYERRTGFRDLIRAVTSSAEVRSAVKGMPLIGSLAGRCWQSWRPNSSNHVAPSSPTAKAAVPPAWLVDLFGPTTTRFSSESARQVLGWSPRFTYPSAMEETRGWLQSLGLRTTDAAACTRAT
jgi:hypothetical protein